MKLLIKFDTWKREIDSFKCTRDEESYFEFLQEHQLIEFTRTAYNRLDYLKPYVVFPDTREHIILCSIQICCILWNTMHLEQDLAKQFTYYELNDPYQEWAYKMEKGDRSVPDLIDNRDNRLIEVKLKMMYSEDTQDYNANVAKMNSDIRNRKNSIEHAHKATKFIYAIMDENYVAKLWEYDENKIYSNKIQLDNKPQKRLDKYVDCSFFEHWWRFKVD